LLDFGKADRRREQDAAAGRATGKLGDRQKRLARQRRGGIDSGAAPIGEQEHA